MTKAMIRKLTIAWMNLPYNTVALPTWIERAAKSMPPRMIPTSGMMMSLTSEVTMAPNAPPKTTAIARSRTLPFKTNALKSFHMVFLLS